MTNFKDLLKKQNNYSEMASKLKKTKKSFVDDRFYKPQKDKDGNASALIRFLPPSASDQVPFIKYHEHTVNIDGRWLITPCPATIGGKCPICQHYFDHYDKNDKEKNGKYANKFKHLTKFISNIVVLKDPANPENEGKVFLFKYTKQIADKISAAYTPAEGFGEEPIDPFSFVDGANFKLVIAKKDAFDTYEGSSFQNKSVLFNGDEDKLEQIWKSEYSLAEFTAPEHFPSFDDLEKRLAYVIGSETGNTSSASDTVLEDADDLLDEELASPVSEDEIVETLADIVADKSEVSDFGDDSDLESLDDLEALLKKQKTTKK